MIPDNTDVVITHEPPVMILDQSSGIHWGNAPLRHQILEVKPRYHLFGHAHNGYGILKQDGIVFSNAAPSLLPHFHLKQIPTRESPC